MKKSGLVPLVRASGFGSLPQLLEERAGERALLKALDSEGLPLAVRELGGMPVPARALIGLFARAGSMLADRTLGLQVGRRIVGRQGADPPGDVSSTAGSAATRNICAIRKTPGHVPPVAGAGLRHERSPPKLR